MINTNYHVPMSKPVASKTATRGRPRAFNRDQALEKAMRVFWEKGFASTSMNDLTSALGIAPPSLYAAFGSKEDLFAEALDLYDLKAQGLNDAIYGQGQSLRDQIEASLRLSARLEGKGMPTGCMVMMACEQASELSDKLMSGLVAKKTRGAHALEERLQQAVDEGELPAHTDIAGLAQMYGVLQRGLAVSGRAGIPDAQMEEAIAAAMKAWDALVQ